jgi:hypothetical protein
MHAQPSTPTGLIGALAHPSGLIAHVGEITPAGLLQQRPLRGGVR